MSSPKAPKKSQVESAAPTPEEETDDETILVQLGPAANVPGKPGATRIFHEFDEQHPGGPNGGEALVTAGQVVRVYPTLRVNQAIAHKLLQRVRNKPATPVPPNVADVVATSPTLAAASAAATLGAALAAAAAATAPAAPAAAAPPVEQQQVTISDTSAGTEQK